MSIPRVADRLRLTEFVHGTGVVACVFRMLCPSAQRRAVVSPCHRVTWRAMIPAEHIEDWRGKEVRDPDGESLGKLQEIYFDVGTGTPILGSIKSGLLGRHMKMIPIDGAVVGTDYLRVKHAKSAIDGSPEADKEDPPNAVELDEIGKAYGLRFSDQVRLEGATAADARRAEAEAARQRAEQAETTAREKAAALEAAQSRAKGATTDAGQAEREAEEAREAARRARADAQRHDEDT